MSIEYRNICESTPKFLIYKTQILMGLVDYHEDLLIRHLGLHFCGVNYQKLEWDAHGGGFFDINHKKETIHFFGKSFKYGKFNSYRLMGATLPAKYKDYEKLIGAPNPDILNKYLIKSGAIKY